MRVGVKIKSGSYVKLGEEKDSLGISVVVESDYNCNKKSQVFPPPPLSPFNSLQLQSSPIEFWLVCAFCADRLICLCYGLNWIGIELTAARKNLRLVEKRENLDKSVTRRAKLNEQHNGAAI